MKGFHTYLCFYLSIFLVGNKLRAVKGVVEDGVCNLFPPELMPSCCLINVYVNETSVKPNYIVTRVNSTEGTIWGLIVNITWDDINTTALRSFEVEWEAMVSEEDLEGSISITPRTGDCNMNFPPTCGTDSRKVVIVDEPYFFTSEVLFSFRYRFRIRVLQDGNPIGTSVCLSAISHPTLFTSPDCYVTTGDPAFCESQPVVTSSIPLNATVTETVMETTLFSLRLSWMQPFQVNGVVGLYVVTLNTSGVATTHNVPVDDNATSSTVYEFVVTKALNDTIYSFQITPFVVPAHGPFLATENIEGNSVFICHRTFFSKPAEDDITTADTPNRSQQMDPPSSPDRSFILIIVLCIAAVIVTILAGIIISKILKKRHAKVKQDQQIYFKPQLTYQTSEKDIKSRQDTVAPEFKSVEIFDYKNIKEGEILGSGQYGEVFKGKAILQGKTTWKVVAIKRPKNAVDPEVIEDFKNEIRLMLELGNHPNIVSVLGCCTVEEPYYLITDFMEYGDLLHFLRKCCIEANANLDPIYKITTKNQLQLAHQIADGMNYVSHTRFFHGDLAARNILVGEGLVVKVTDFGLTDDLYQKGYTRLQSDAKRPYKWYSPESIEHQFCTLKTDIWSFGVLLWEILTFGQQTPYHGMSIQEVLYRLKDGYRMPCPNGTPEFMEKLIHRCWQLDPEERPSFGDLYETITFLLERGAEPDNYITAENEEAEKITEDKRPTGRTQRKSLVELLNFEDIDPSEISGSSESAFSGASKVSRGYSSKPLSVIVENEGLTEGTSS